MGNVDLVYRRLVSKTCMLFFLYGKINPKAFRLLTLKGAFPFLLVGPTVQALELSSATEVLGSCLHLPPLAPKLSCFLLLDLSITLDVVWYRPSFSSPSRPALVQTPGLGVELMGHEMALLSGAFWEKGHLELSSGT